MARIASAALATLLSAACGGDRTATPSAEAGGATAAAVAPAATRLVAPEPIRHVPRIAVTGTLKARQASPLAMRVPGTLVRIAVARGEEVRSGALLASLDPAAAAATGRQAEAAVAAARAQLALADDALGRVARIREAEGVSEAQLVQARSQRELAAAQLAQAEAQLELARVHLAHHQLRAPFAGVITRIPEGIGVTVAPGVPLVTLVSTRQLVLETSLTQEDAAGLRAGAPAIVTVPATGARTSEAKVQVVVPAADPATNRVPIEISVPNPDGRFLPNAFARAELPRAPERDAWRVPAAALVQRAGGYSVWVARGGTARTLAVRLLAEEADGAVVVPEDGSWPEDLRVIAAPPPGIAEGLLVAEAGR
jgi:RND family efflux transporter MFP subunit